MQNLSIASVMIVFVLFSGCAGIHSEEGGASQSMSSSAQAEVASKWGVSPVSIRLTGAGHFVDFRYVVEDPEKAKPVLARGKQVSLTERSSGRVLGVAMTKLGPLKGSTTSPVKGKTYSILFSNTEGIIKKGSEVTVLIGDLKIESLTVE